MNGDLRLVNRQRSRAVDMGQLRKVVEGLFTGVLDIREFDLTIHLVSSPAMALLNKRHLDHDGPTDVITLDYGSDRKTRAIVGEIFVCVEVAVEQARRFRTRWQRELVRYIIHGILHLGGHDDLQEAARRRMKREENRLVKKAAGLFPLTKLERK